MVIVLTAVAIVSIGGWLICVGLTVNLPTAVELILEYVGALAIFFAIAQYRSSQSKPKVSLVILNRTDALNTYHTDLVEGSNASPQTSGNLVLLAYIHVFHFDLVADNQGNIPAKNIKISIKSLHDGYAKVASLEQPRCFAYYLLRDEAAVNSKFHKEELSLTDTSLTPPQRAFILRGKEHLFIYSRDKKSHLDESTHDLIASFQLNVPVRPGETRQIKFATTFEAENQSRVNQTFTFLVPAGPITSA